MKIDDQIQMARILQNLNMLEISYIDYSKGILNFQDYKTYLNFFENNIIRSRSLAQLYFPISIGQNLLAKSSKPSNIQANDSFSISAEIDFSMYKIFNFPASIPHSCNYYTGIYILDGSGNLTVNDQEFPLKKGDFYLIPPHVIYHVHTEPESIGIYFDIRRSFIAAEYKMIFHEHPLISQFITESLKQDHSMTYLALHSSGNEFLREIILQMFMEYLNREPYSKQAMDHYLSLFFVGLLRDPDISIDSSVSMSRMSQQYHLIENYLHKNYQHTTLALVSEHMHFSKQYICRIIKEEIGDTFNNLLMRIRLEKAEAYLEETDLTLESIAELCGFSAASHFSRVFKAHFGITPSAYRRKHNS